MTITEPVVAHHAAHHQALRDARNAALLAAEHERHLATHEAEVEYAETVGKLREQFEIELFEAKRRRIAAVTPAHRAYNAAVIAAETAFAELAAALTIR